MIEKFLRKLVSFRTVSSDHKENRRALTWIVHTLQPLGLRTRFFSSGGFPALIVTTQRTKKPTLWLVGHLDVVDASPRLFRVQKKAHHIIGRGVFDMKYAISCFMALFYELKHGLAEYNIGMLITTDEEVGGRHGTDAVLRAGYGGKVAFVPDSGDNWEIRVGAKGGWQFQAIAHGESGHGSRPWEGKNAIVRLIEFLSTLQSKFPNEPCGKKNHDHMTMNVGVIHGGEAANKIPDRAYALVDIRFPSHVHGSTTRGIVARVKTHFPQIQIEDKAFVESYAVDIKNKYIQQFLAIVRHHRIRPRFAQAHGSCDARYFISRGIPTIVVRPCGGAHHSEREWIDIKDMERFYKVLREFVEQVAKC